MTFDHLPTRHRHARPSSSGKHTFSIPDLRFEQSYLHSLQRYIHRDDAQGCLTTKSNQRLPSTAVKGKSTKEMTLDTAEKARTKTGSYGVPLRMDWGGIFFVTVRNQILSPLAQGAVLALLTVYLRPFLRTLGARVRAHVLRSWQSIFPPIEPHIQGGAGWMRKQLREFSVGGVGANIALGQ